VDCIHLGQDRALGRALCEHGDVPAASIKGGEFD
jgi:hypothetical protein